MQLVECKTKWNYMTYWVYFENRLVLYHYSEVIMMAIASQITGISIVYSTICSGAYQRKHQNSVSLGFVPCDEWIPTKRASNAENFSIWWRHHDSDGYPPGVLTEIHLILLRFALCSVLHIGFRSPLSPLVLFVNYYLCRSRNNKMQTRLLNSLELFDSFFILWNSIPDFRCNTRSAASYY